MTGAEIAAIISASAALTTAIGGMVIGLFNLRQSKETHVQIKEVVHNTNSLAEQLQKSEHSRGLREGRAEGKKTTEGKQK